MSAEQLQRLSDQVQMLTTELAAQRLELDAAKTALEQQTQTATAALTVAQTAVAQLGQSETKKKTLNPKLVNPPDPFQGTDADWERYKFGFVTWIGTVDPSYPDLLKKAESEKDEVAAVELSEGDEQLSTNLFAILVGQCQHGEIPAMAMLVPDRNGLELWRRMYARFEPENKHKPFAWLRALSNPTFPTKESLWQRGLEEWEGEIAKYEREYGKSFDEDLKLAILSEVAPKALAPQIAMNSASLTSYKSMREFVVQYLKSKNLWKRTAGTTFGSAAASSTPGATNSGPVPMDVGALDGQDQAGKSKGKTTAQKGNQNSKGGKKGGAKGDGKGKEKGKGNEPNKKQQGKGAHCAICGPEKGKNHTTEECYFNARSNPKGDSKGGKKGSRNTSTVNAVDGAYDDASVPSMLTTLQQQVDALKQAAAGQSASQTTAPASQKKTHQGAVTAHSADMCFAVCHSPAKAVEIDDPSEQVVSHPPVPALVHVAGVAAQTSAKYIMVDSGATTSCANKMVFPEAPVDTSKKKDLWAINGTPIQHEGEQLAQTAIAANTASGEPFWIPATFRMEVTDAMEPVMAFCRILDEADCDMHFYRSSSGKTACIQTPDGHTIDLPRFGARFYLPYQDRPPNMPAPQFVAAMDEHEHDQNKHGHEQSEDEEGEGDMELSDLVDGQPLDPIGPQPLPEPETPTDEQRAKHDLTHADFAAWCPHCVAGKAPEDKHARKDKHEDQEVPVIQLDYQFFSRDGELVEEESRAATVLTGTDTSSGYPFMIFVPRKGVDTYVVKSLMVWINRLGYKKVIVQHDSEEALRALVEQVQQKLGADKVQVRASPPYSHQSQGGAENTNRLMAGMLRTWLSALRAKYPDADQPLDINHNVIPWLCRWIAFVWARYHIKHDRVTAFKIVTGREYTSPIVQFGEVVMGKVPNVKAIAKSQPRWFKGLFVGRAEADDSAVLLTHAGAFSVRSIRRLPSPDQHDVEYLDSACGLPWALTNGTRTKIRTESSKVIPMLPPPTGSDEATSDNSSESSPSSSSGAPGPTNSEQRPVMMMPTRVSSTPGADPIEEPRSPSYAPTTPMLTPQSFEEVTVQGMTPPSNGDPLAMTPPGSPEEIPLSNPGNQVTQSENTGATAVAVPLPKRELGGDDPSPTKVPRIEVQENRAPSQPGPGSESPTKIQRIGTITAALEQIQDWARNGQWENRIASVLDLLDTQLDPKEVEKARDVQMATLVEKEFAIPKLRRELPRQSKLFHFKWVDEIKRGAYRSRFTCADMKRKYTREELAEETNTFAPTPYEESHVLLELKCLQNGWNTRSADVRCAYLLGRDSGDSAGNPVHIRVPPEYQPYFQAWLRQQPPEVQSKFDGVDLFKDVVLELVGNLYGRRPAGNNYRKEFEHVVTEKMATKGYQFQRGKRDPTVYTCARTGATILHHVDDLRVGAADADLEFLLSKQGLGEFLDMKVGKVETPGTKVNVLGRTKVRTQDAFFTLPEEKHRENILTLLDLWHAKPSRVAGMKIPRTEDNTKPVDEQRAVLYPKCVGSAIYLSIDRRDVRYEVKELARHMRDPREVDWENLLTLGRYLLHRPTLARIVTLNPESKASGILTVDGFTDSDWAGCLDTRRSSDCSLVIVGGSVVIAHPQTQPGLPATSSGEAETRALSRGARDVMFIKQLGEEDFNLKMAMPRAWTDASTALQTAKRLGAGSRMRHIDVAALYVQELVYQKQLKVGKVAGTANPSNCLTKHLNAKLKDECLQDLGMVDITNSDWHPLIEAAEQIELVAALLSQRPKSKANTPWKPNFAIAADAFQICILQSLTRPSSGIALE